MEIKQIELSKIKANPLQPRETFEREKLKELANSIKEGELLQPIVVRRVDGKYEIVAGERRFKAHQILKKSSIPVIIWDIKDDIDALEKSLIENLHREDLTSVERENAIYELWKSGKYKSKEALSKKLAISESSIRRLLKGKEDRDTLGVGHTVSTETISATRGIDDKSRKKLIKKIEKGDISSHSRDVRKIADVVKKVSEPVKKALLEDEITVDEAEDISQLDKKKQEAAITSIKHFKSTVKQIPKSIKDDKVIKEQRKTALDVIKKLNSELGSTTTKMYKISDILDGFHEDKIFDAIPKEYKETISGILNELKTASEELNKSIKKAEVDLI